MDAYQQYIHKSRYARYLPEEQRRETWVVYVCVVARVVARGFVGVVSLRDCACVWLCVVVSEGPLAK